MRKRDSERVVDSENDSEPAMEYASQKRYRIFASAKKVMREDNGGAGNVPKLSREFQ